MTSNPARRLALALLLTLPALGHAQQFIAELPDAPSAAQDKAPEKPQDPQGTASITGVVLDIEETTVAHATITLTGASGLNREVFSDNEGHFTLTGLPAGDFKIIIVSKGLETLEFPDIHITAGEQHHLLRIAMPLSVSTSVNVVATPDEIANEQVKEQEHQRVLGIFPNFYSTYIWDAAPLKAHNKFSLATHSLLDPVAFITAGITAGIEQAHNTFPGYGDDAASFGKRYGAVLADHITGRYLSAAVFPSIFHQDPRYFYMGRGTIPHRAFYAISSTVIVRGDNSHRQFAYSQILGSLSAAAISNLYREPSDRTFNLTIRNTFIGLGTRAVNNLIREFVFRRLVTHVPPYANGKPADLKAE